MSPELIHALACYREWLLAQQAEQRAAKRMRDTLNELTAPDCDEYDRRIETIRAEFED